RSTRRRGRRGPPRRQWRATDDRNGRMRPRLVLSLSIVLGFLSWPSRAFAATGPAPLVDPTVPDPWDSVRVGLVWLAILPVLLAIVIVAIRVPAVRPVIVFVVIAGFFSLVALVVGFGVSFAHIDTGMTDFERTTLNFEVGALL